jgi:co-chaperonin GroES (HSP10)
MAAKPQKPTKQQLEQAKLRASSSGIKMDQSAKGLRNAGKVIAVGASLLPAGRGVKAAATVVKAVKTAQAVKKLAPEEKYAVKFVKDIAKKGKPGDVKKTLDAMPSSTKQQFSQALRKAGGDRSAVYKPTKQAMPEKIKGPGTDLGIKKTATGKIKVTNNGTGNSFTVPKKTEMTQKGIVKALVKKNKSK